MSDQLQEIRGVIESAEPVAAAPDAGVGERKPKTGENALDPRCPVIPLGINEDCYYYLDAMRQMRMLKAGKHARLEVMSLFGTKNDVLYKLWPRHGKDGEITGWRPELAAEDLFKAAADCGVMDVVDRVRGPGAWADEDGDLVMHCGDAIYHKDNILEPGRIGRHVYPAAPEKPRPSAIDPGTQPAEELFALLKSWNWRRPDIDPHMLLGWIGASMIGGALKWRPIAWVTGDKATGKSTLHEVLKMVAGPGGLISASDATAAGLWQSVGHSSLPIVLDELEAEQDDRKASNIIKLARHAASGGSTLRGGSDHKGTSFTIRNCFLFSSILIPPMLGQDVSRMAILNLDKLEGATSPRLEPRKLAEIGAALRRRLISQWPQLEDRLETYRQMLAQAGHGGRGADLFGTILACYDLLMFPAPPDSDTLQDWAEHFNKANLAESENDIADHERCLSHLMTQIADIYRNGERRTIASWIQQAAGKLPGKTDDGEANRVLGSFCMKVAKVDDVQYLFVANSGAGIASLFKDSHWAGRSGTVGVWVQSLRRIPGACAHGSNLRFEGAPLRCTRIPIKEILED